MKFATAALIAIATQATQVFAATAVDPVAEECGTLGVMKYTPTADDNVNADQIRKCKEHPLSVNGISAGPDTAGRLDKRECWYGDDFGCQQGFCWEKCDGKDGKWCWSAWNNGLGEWRTCDSKQNCQPGVSGSACGQGGCKACGCGC